MNKHNGYGSKCGLQANTFMIASGVHFFIYIFILLTHMSKRITVFSCNLTNVVQFLTIWMFLTSALAHPLREGIEPG